jgi:dipeptidyl aminopeptidase/acylaminoacyl peptidase
MLGTSGGVKELEGDVGGNLNQSSSVQAVVDLFGPSDMEKQVRKRHKQSDPDFDTKARLVSPVTYVGKNDPPLLIYHGTADPVVPIEQSRIIDKKYKEAGLESTKIEIKDGKHGFKPSEFDRKTETERMAKFFDKHLK